jgi:hypothetical protein
MALSACRATGVKYEDHNATLASSAPGKSRMVFCRTGASSGYAGLAFGAIGQSIEASNLSCGGACSVAPRGEVVAKGALQGLALSRKVPNEPIVFP